MLKTKSVLSSFLVCSSIYSFADQNVPVSQRPDDRVNYPSNFQVEEGWDLFVFGDYLYWTANEDGLYFAQTGAATPTGVVPPDGSINFNGKLKQIHPQSNSGLRIGVGLNFPHSGIDTTACWTWFATNGHTSSSPGTATLLPLWAEPDFTPFALVTQATGNWDLNMNILDLEWGGSYWMGAHLSFAPFFALRGALIDQSLKVDYTYATAPVTSSHLHSNADFKGGGLRVGCMTRFVLPCDFALYGLFSGSLLYGQINSNLNITEDAATIAHTKDLLNKGISSMQVGLGAGWDTHFHKDRLHLELHVGWEMNQWFSINEMNHFMNQLSTGNYFKENGTLSTQGLVAGARFDF